MKKTPLLLIIGILAIQCNPVEKTDNQSSTINRDSLEKTSLPEVIESETGIKTQAEAENELIRLVQENIQAAEEEDLEKAMRILDETKSNFEKNKAFTQKLFDLYDLDYEIESIEVIEQTEETAMVEMTHVMKKIAGPEFRDQRTNTILHLKKVNDQWKIEKRNVRSTVYL